MRCAWEKLLSILPPTVARQLDTRDRQTAREIRLRLGAAPEINLGSTRRELVGAVSQEDLKYTLNLASKYSPWCAATLSQGYLTAPGGHRIGVCGEGIFRQGQTEGFRSIRSLCVRVARDFPGVGEGLEGTSTLIIGAPGWGKTTLLRILCGLTRPTRGRLLLFGAADAARQSEMRRRMGSLVDGPALYAELTAWQNLKVQCLQRGLNEADIAPTLKLVGLKDTGSKPAGKFSLGMRQRLGLAVALLGKPKFLVLDEPLNGLDPMGIQELRHLLEKLNREQGMTILLSSHILSELHQLATSYGILHKGQLLEQLTAEELDARCSKYLLVHTDNDRRAADILRKMFPEATCQATCQATVEGLRLSPVGNEAAATASGVLMENGLHVQELAVRSEGLEAYFTALVGGDSHADAG